MKKPLAKQDLTETLRRARAEVQTGHNSFVYVPEEPLAAADACERPLGALPIAVKDVIDCQGMPTAAGSKFTRVQPRSAEIVEVLVSQGASVVGKTQAHQFSFGTTGDVSFAGPVRNARDPEFMAGGSSGGSAVAVAQEIVSATVGTDTAGSIRIPAALNSVSGFKPTHDILSSEGIFPLSPSLDTAGFLSRDVSTLIAIWRALQDLGTSPIDQGNRSVPPIRFGVLHEETLSGMASTVASRFAETVERLETKTHLVGETPRIDLGILRSHYLTIIGWEGSMVHGGFSRVAPDLYDDEIRQSITSISGVTFKDYFEALKEAEKVRHKLERLFEDFDVLVSPTLAIETPTLGQRIVRDDSGLDQVWGALAHFTSPWNVVGFPAISIPIPGAKHPAPVGLQLIGKPHGDHELLLVAQTVERLLRGS